MSGTWPAADTLLLLVLFNAAVDVVQIHIVLAKLNGFGVWVCRYLAEARWRQQDDTFPSPTLKILSPRLRRGAFRSLTSSATVAARQEWL
jgi:hypothetical protein